MEHIKTAILYELQETNDVDTVVNKIAGWLRYNGHDDLAAAQDLRCYFRNSQSNGQRNPHHHYSCY